MSTIITIIIRILNTFNKLIWKFMCFLSKFINPEDINLLHDKPANERYRKFKVDDNSIIEPYITFESMDYKKLINNNNISPIKRHKGKDITINISCPRCHAPKDYLYDNSKGVQFECKCCSLIFSHSTRLKLDNIIMKCPHCTSKLSLAKERADFNVYKCPSKTCPYYLKNINAMNATDISLFIKDPSKFKLHYIYRAFNVDLPTLTKEYREFIQTPIDLSKAYHSSYIIGLCLTYHVNYGMSYRQVASILYDVHEVKLSHATVENYCKAVSSIIHPVLEFYPYQLSSFIAADETYIKILGKTNYIFFYFDSINKIVTSYRVFDKRDSLSSIKAAYSTLIKFDELPKDLKVISDGNPIYNVAQTYWQHHNMPFALFQVIGLKNYDPISKEYRSYKQIIERHNRTLKYYYRPKGGFTSLDNANSYMVLFATCFNFLRPHSSLKYNTPVIDERISNCSNMPIKWIELINMGYEYSKIYG